MAFGQSRRLLLVGLLSGSVGCGGGDDDDAAGSANGVSAPTVASFEGTYALTAFTENDAGCDTDGSSRLSASTDLEFVMVGTSAFGSYVELVSCNDVASCAEAVQNVRRPGPILADYALILSIEVGPDRLDGLNATGGFPMGGKCVYREYDGHALTRSGDSVRIESRYTPLPDVPATADSCPIDVAKLRQEAATQPCAELRVIEGTKTGPLPE
jgi:hypothetical protein